MGHTACSELHKLFVLWLLCKNNSLHSVHLVLGPSQCLCTLGSVYVNYFVNFVHTWFLCTLIDSMQCTVCTQSVPILHTLYTLHLALSTTTLCNRCPSAALCTARRAVQWTYSVLSVQFALAACWTSNACWCLCKRFRAREISIEERVNCPNI